MQLIVNQTNVPRSSASHSSEQVEEESRNEVHENGRKPEDTERGEDFQARIPHSTLQWILPQHGVHVPTQQVPAEGVVHGRGAVVNGHLRRPSGPKL